MRLLTGRFLAALLILAGVGSSARAELARVGPVNAAPSVGSFPAWYQDKTGLTLEFCDPKNQAEVDAGLCLLLPGDVTVPEVFPTNFFDEHFYFAAGSTMTTAAAETAILTLAVESAFAVGAPVPGDQVTFGRIRVKLTAAPLGGTYRVIHPFGEEIFTGVVAGERIFFTDDVGINCSPGNFECALQSRLTFLFSSATPGGPEDAPFTTPLVPGSQYLADPNRLGPVTGSVLPDFLARANSGQTSGGTPRNHNIFRIEGPQGCGIGGPGQDFIETTDFSLMGRIHTGVIPGKVTVDRASYTANPTGQKLDVFATGAPTTQGRLPTQPTPAATVPVLSFFDAACASSTDAAGAPIPPFSAPVGAIETPMVSSGTSYWAQIQPAAAIPTAVCVKDGVNATYLLHPVTDEVSILNAFFSANAGVLTVNATSSDEVNPATLTLGGFGDLVDGQIAVSTVAPPAKVRVLSSFGGSSELQVTTAFGSGLPVQGPVAVADTASFVEDGAGRVLDLLANDTAVTGGVVALVGAAPAKGTAVLNPATNQVTYTPNPNATGNDSFFYAVTVGTSTSPPALVSITIAPVNDAPVAVNDIPAPVLVNATVLLPSLIANDTDPDGNGDVVAATSFSGLTPSVGAVITFDASGRVTFRATVAGTYTFTYRARDASGALSGNVGQVTVNVVNGDTVTITSAQYRTTSFRWVITGRTTVPNQTITISYADGPAVGFQIGTAQADGAGNWILDIKDVTGSANPTTLNPRPTRVRATSSLGGSGTLTFTTRT
jgi:Bacterial Ig domain